MYERFTWKETDSKGRCAVFEDGKEFAVVRCHLTALMVCDYLNRKENGYRHPGSLHIPAST